MITGGLPVWFLDELVKFNPEIRHGLDGTWNLRDEEIVIAWNRAPMRDREHIQFIAVGLGFDLNSLGFLLGGFQATKQPIGLEPMPSIQVSSYQNLSAEQKRAYLAHAGKLAGGRRAQVKWSLEIAPYFRDKDRMALIGMTQQGGRDGFSALKRQVTGVTHKLP